VNISHPSFAEASSPGIASWLIAQQRFLRWGLLLSVAIHLALLAWHRAAPPVSTPRPSELEIVMVNAATESEPSQAQLLAQTNVDGGGQAQTGYQTTLIPLTGESVEPVMLEALTQQRQQLELQQQQLLTQLTSRERVALGRPATNPTDSSDVAGEDEVDQVSMILNGQIAVLKQRIERDNAHTLMLSLLAKQPMHLTSINGDSVSNKSVQNTTPVALMVSSMAACKQP
jgi:protein TonB